MVLQANPLLRDSPALIGLPPSRLPGGRVSRCVVRAVLALARSQIVTVHGIEHVHPSRDPFILALNHSNRLESVLVPTLLIRHRHGRLIHFLADWNFRLIPVVGLIYRLGETITVTRKSARPKVLNVLKPLYREPRSALERTRRHLAAGRSVGIFPEGTVNRNARQLAGGRKGAAYLSLATGVPVVPAGIRFPAAENARISDWDAMEVVIGAPMTPPPIAARMTPADLHAWHAAVMSEIGRLCGKRWPPSEEPT